MKVKRKFKWAVWVGFSAVLLAFMSNISNAQNDVTKWSINPALSLATFKITNLGLEVNGTISGLTFESNFIPKKLNESYIKGSAQTKTLFTDNEERDNHIKKDDFFDVDKFPLIKIETSKIYKTKTGYAAIAKIEIKGVAKETKIPFSMFSSKKLTFLTSEFTINRLDFGVGDDGVILSDEVKIKLNLNLIKPNK